jgi:hypothetical protein
MPQLYHGLEEPVHERRSGIAVGRGNIVIEHQNGSASVSVAGSEERSELKLALPRELLSPFLAEAVRVQNLKSLHSLGFVSSGGCSLVMEDDGRWLIPNGIACVPQGKTEIGVFPVSGRVVWVQAADFLKGLPPYQQRCSGTIIDFANIVVLWSLRVVEPAVVPRRAIAPDDPPGLLERSVREEKLGAHGAPVRSGT